MHDPSGAGPPQHRPAGRGDRPAERVAQRHRAGDRAVRADDVRDRGERGPRHAHERLGHRSRRLVGGRSARGGGVESEPAPGARGGVAPLDPGGGDRDDHVVDDGDARGGGVRGPGGGRGRGERADRAGAGEARLLRRRGAPRADGADRDGEHEQWRHDAHEQGAPSGRGRAPGCPLRGCAAPARRGLVVGDELHPVERGHACDATLRRAGCQRPSGNPLRGGPVRPRWVRAPRRAGGPGSRPRARPRCGRGRRRWSRWTRARAAPRRP